MRQLKITNRITHRDGMLDRYLQEIHKIPLVSPEEEVQLARRIRAGSQRAFDELVRANLRFVVSVAKQYEHYGLTLSDLINEGNLGLCKAAARFDETRGFKFISYAVWWIRQAILQGIAETGYIVRLPLNKNGQVQKIGRERDRLYGVQEYEPTPEDVAEAAKLKEDHVRLALTLTERKHYSLDRPLDDSDESSSTFGDLLKSDGPSADELVNDGYHKDLLLAAIKQYLPKREQEVIMLSFGLNGYEQKDLDGIGSELGLGRERARQIKERAIQRLQYSKKFRALFKDLR